MTNPTPDQPRMSVPEAEAALAPLEAKVRAGREVQQTGGRAALRDRIAAALMDLGHPQWDAAEGADAVLTVLSEPTDQAAGVGCTCFVVNDGGVHAASCAKRPTAQAAVRAATLREAADWYAQQGKTVLAASQVAADLHRRAGGDAPLSPYYEHPECGFHWHGRDGMDIPIRDGQPVCPRCELAKVQKKLDYTQRMREEVGTECKRRGKRMLEQAEQIRTLEQQLDEVRRQLGEEILRAGQAEDENARLRTGQAAVRAAALREAALHLYTALFPTVYNDLGQKAAEGVNRAVSELHRLADEQPTTPTALQPRRGDQFEAWLKTQRDRYDRHGESDEFWHEFDRALDEYRLHADMGVPLDGHVCEARVVGDCECLEPAGPAAPAKDTPDGCTCAVAGDAFAPAGHYADCPAAPAKETPTVAVHAAPNLSPAAAEALDALVDVATAQMASEEQPDGEPIVAYRSLGGRILRCLDHVPPEPDTDFVALTAEDLPDGGICTFPVPPCGRDVLTVAEQPR